MPADSSENNWIAVPGLGRTAWEERRKGLQHASEICIVIVILPIRRQVYDWPFPVGNRTEAFTSFRDSGY